MPGEDVRSRAALCEVDESLLLPALPPLLPFVHYETPSCSLCCCPGAFSHMLHSSLDKDIMVLVL